MEKKFTAKGSFGTVKLVIKENKTESMLIIERKTANVVLDYDEEEILNLPPNFRKRISEIRSVEIVQTRKSTPGTVEYNFVIVEEDPHPHSVNQQEAHLDLLGIFYNSIRFPEDRYDEFADIKDAFDELKQQTEREEISV